MIFLQHLVSQPNIPVFNPPIFHLSLRNRNDKRIIFAREGTVEYGFKCQGKTFVPLTRSILINKGSQSETTRGLGFHIRTTFCRYGDSHCKYGYGYNVNIFIGMIMIVPQTASVSFCETCCRQ